MKSKLDTSAIVHCALMNENVINNYRISLTVDRKVDPLLLQRAVDKMVDRFPMICCRITSDGRWYYSEKMDKVTVKDDTLPILRSLNHKNVFEQAVNIIYTDNKIILEAFHSVTDGFGAFTFLNALLVEYYDLLDGGEGIDWGVYSERECEDGFIKFGNADKIIKDPVDHSNGFKFRPLAEGEKLGFSSFRLNLRQTKNLAKSYRCTLNEMILTIIYYGIFSLDYSMGKNVVLTVPVNLRNKFESPTLHNFSFLANASVRSSGTDKPVEEVIREIRTQLHKQNNKEYLHSGITKIARLIKNPLVGYAPISLKNLLIRVGAAMGGDKGCMTVSNLGDISRMLPDSVDHITALDIMMSPRRNSPFNCCIASLNGRLCLNFTHGVSDSPFLKGIRSFLHANGVEFTQVIHQ
ncbi:MAG: hypothetical protein IJ410_09450 [Oscillospiraceae bacterium]|nr:hypothetical protein [Oscillospiraceae bacterium]